MCYDSCYDMHAMTSPAMTDAETHGPLYWQSAAPAETRRLVLRDFTFEDVPRIARYAADPKVSRMLAIVPFPYTEAHASAFVGDVLASNATGDGLGLAIARKKEPGALIGIISFARDGDTAEIGWWLGPPYWGKGFASEAVMAMIAIAFRDPSLKALTAGAFADNPASLRVQDKAGFTPLGMRQRPSLARGEEAAHVDTILTRQDYEAAIHGSASAAE
jgi:ribosomal-protein-alanine N-acetyltransferase